MDTWGLAPALGTK